MKAVIFRKCLAVGVITIFAMASLSPVYAGFVFKETKFNDKITETTKVDIRNPLDRETFLDRYDSSNLAGRYHEHPYPNNPNHRTKHPISTGDSDWDIIVPDDYSTIQEAVDAADMGYRILVKAGIYEENVEIDVKSLTLHGENRNNTIIDGSGKDHVIKVTSDADGVNISDFTIKNSGEDNAGLNITSHYNIIQDNIIINNGDGIQLYLSSGNQIQNNQIIDNNDGLWLHRSNGNNLIENIITENGENGVEFTYSSLGTIIDNNEISGHNECGIYLDESSLGNMFTRCTIKNNDVGVQCAGVSDGNIFHHNVFMENDVNAFDSSLDQWDYEGIGNYWDDYNGTDSDGDGIGDTPYVISGGSNKDRYPLMNPALMGEHPEQKTERETNSIYETGSDSIKICSNNDGWDIIVPDEYPTIQEAVDNADVGYRILVRHGVYYENIVIDKPSLTIHGENKDTTIIDGSGADHVVKATNDSNGLNVSGFTIRSGNNQFNGLYVYSNFTMIENNVFEDCNIGIALRENGDNVVKGNNFYDNNFGLWIWMCIDSIIEDNTIENDILDGIALQQSTGITIIGNQIENNTYNGILQIKSLDIHIKDNTVGYNDEFAVQMFSSEGNIIECNNIQNNSNGGISLYKSTANTFANNIILDNGNKSFWDIIPKGNGISFWFYSGENHIENNEIKSNGGDGVFLQHSINNAIALNNLTNNWNGIYLSFSSGNNITSNKINENNYGIGLFYSSNNHITCNNLNRGGIDLSYSSDNSIEDNTINNSYYGIYPFTSSNNNIVGNNIFNNGFSGIYLSECSNNNNIVGNNIFNNGFSGLYLDSSSYNIISGNTIKNNDDNGIELRNSNDNSITGNNISNNNYDGLYLFASSNNNIACNNILNNSHSGIYLSGIYLYSNSINNNLIYHNNFIANDEQAYFDTSIFNLWLRNYWDDHSGLHPRPIYGKISFIRLGGREIKWVNFDWYPLQKPF